MIYQLVNIAATGACTSLGQPLRACPATSLGSNDPGLPVKGGARQCIRHCADGCATVIGLINDAGRPKIGTGPPLGGRLSSGC